MRMQHSIDGNMSSKINTAFNKIDKVENKIHDFNKNFEDFTAQVQRLNENIESAIGKITKFGDIVQTLSEVWDEVEQNESETT